VKSEDNLQEDSSFNGFHNNLFFVSSLAQVAKHQMTVLSRFGVHICIIFWVELNVNQFYMTQATFLWRLLHTSNILFKMCPPCNFCPPLLRHPGDGPACIPTFLHAWIWC